MIRKITLLIVALAAHSAVHAQNMTLSIDQDDFIVSNLFSDVDTFSFSIEFAVPLTRGNFIAFVLPYPSIGMVGQSSRIGYASFATHLRGERGAARFAPYLSRCGAVGSPISHRTTSGDTNRRAGPGS